MKTEMVLKRELFGQEISQKHKSEYFSATDLERAGNRWRISKGLKPFDKTMWFQQDNVKEFIAAIEAKHNCKAKISARGRGKHTWVHPILFIDMALAIHPDLKLEVYSWLYDYLTKYRDQSGDSHKLMCGALWQTYSNKQKFGAFAVKVGLAIQEKVGCRDWERATQTQLRNRDLLHRHIASLASGLKDANQAVRIGLATFIGEGENTT